MSGASLPVAILAGGLATRLQPMTEQIPKCLLDVHGEPFLAHQLRLLGAKGIERAVLCVGHLGEKVRDFVEGGRGFGLEVAVQFDGPRLLGTAGALAQALPLLGEAFFVLYGDSYLDCDYRSIQTEFLSRRSLGLMTVFRNAGRWDSSNVEFAGGVIRAYDKRRRTPRMEHIDYGLGLLRAAALDGAAAGQPADLAELYQSLLARGELAGYEVDQRFYEIGSLQGLEETRQLLAERDRNAARRDR